MPQKKRDDTARVAVVEDEVNMRGLLSRILEGEGYQVDSFDSAEGFLRKFEAGKYGVIVQDVRMPGMDGIEMLKNVVEQDHDVQAVVITAYSTGETAVEAMRLGAFSYVRKPFDSDEIRRVVKMAFERHAEVVMKSASPFTVRHIVHDSQQMREVVDHSERRC